MDTSTSIAQQQKIITRESLMTWEQFKTKLQNCLFPELANDVLARFAAIESCCIKDEIKCTWCFFIGEHAENFDNWLHYGFDRYGEYSVGEPPNTPMYADHYPAIVVHRSSLAVMAFDWFVLPDSINPYMSEESSQRLETILTAPLEKLKGLA